MNNNNNIAIIVADAGAERSAVGDLIKNDRRLD